MISLLFALCSLEEITCESTDRVFFAADRYNRSSMLLAHRAGQSFFLPGGPSHCRFSGSCCDDSLYGAVFPEQRLPPGHFLNSNFPAYPAEFHVADFQNTFSWSHSRHLMFNRCRRKYFLNYYGSWGGWNRDAPPEVREAYIQKKLTTIPMWIGSLVHDAAETALKGLQRGRPVRLDHLLDMISDRARSELEASQRGLWRQNPSRVTAFQEHYYKVERPPEAWNKATAQIRSQVRHLYDNPVYLRLTQVPDKLQEVEGLEKIDVGGIPVWVKLDALVADGRGGLVIIDWKTGTSHDNAAIATQMGVYGLYCADRYQVSPEKLIAMHVNLRTGKQLRHPIDDDGLERTKQHVASSSNQMLNMLRDQDSNQATAEDFAMLAAGSAFCSRCRFRGTCQRG